MEARGMSKVTKTILILQRDSWTVAHSRASRRFLSTSRLLFSHFHRRSAHLHRPRRSQLGSFPLLLCSTSAPLSPEICLLSLPDAQVVLAETCLRGVPLSDSER